MLEAEALLGAWRLRSFRVSFEDGREPLWPLGKDAEGMLIYAPSGHMSAVLSRKDRAPLGVARVESSPRASDRDKAAALDSYVSYAGRFRVGGYGQVLHDVDLALLPDVVGQVNARRAKLDGDTLVLSYEVTPASKVTRSYRLEWQRCHAT